MSIGPGSVVILAVMSQLRYANDRYQQRADDRTNTLGASIYYVIVGGERVVMEKMTK